MALEPLTWEELDMINHFHFNKGDITQWKRWEDVLPRVEAHHPELLKAMKDVEIATRILNSVVRSLCE